MAAPFATRQLADLGARVVKVERPVVGDFARGYDATVKGLSSHFVWLNRSKESLTPRPEAARGARRWWRGSSTGRTSSCRTWRPARRTGWAWTPGRCAGRRPRLVVCNVSGYGATGPYRDKKAYDLLVQAEAGLVSITGTADQVGEVFDIGRGHRGRHVRLLRGADGPVPSRAQREEGATIEVSMLEALAEWMGFPLYYTLYGGKPPARSGARHAAIAPLRSVRGRRRRDGVPRAAERARVGALLRRGVGTAGAGHRPALRRQLRNGWPTATRWRLRSTMSSRTSPPSRFVGRLEAAQIANGRMNSVFQLGEHPQLRARDRWREVPSSAGPLRATLPPATLDGAEPRMDAIPEVGQHTAAILAGARLSRRTPSPRGGPRASSDVLRSFRCSIPSPLPARWPPPTLRRPRSRRSPTPCGRPPIHGDHVTPDSAWRRDHGDSRRARSA